MRKTKPVISFEKSFLHNLANQENSCVELQEQKYHLALHPFHLTNINNSIKDLLGQGIARYDKKLHGILLGYENIKLLTEGTIVDDSFFVHVDVSANFFLFKPEVDKVLFGFVNKKSEDHVGCLVYETFNVSIPKPEEQDHGDWMGSTVEIGDEISFKITFLKLEARLPYIRGELLTIPNNTVLHEPEGIIDNDETPKKKSKKKKRVKQSSEDELIEEPTPKKERHSGEYKKKKRKDSKISSSKKRFRDETSDNDNYESKKEIKKNGTAINEDGEVLDNSAKNKKQSLVNGEVDEYERVQKKKKKKKHRHSLSESIGEVSNIKDESISIKLNDENDLVDDDSPKKKKKKKKAK